MQDDRSILSLTNVKGRLSPAQVFDNNISIPKDYFSIDNKEFNSNQYNSNLNFEKFGKVSKILHKTVDSSNDNVIKSNSYKIQSSNDSLISLVERQHQMKINHPYHQLYNSNIKDNNDLKSSIDNTTINSSIARKLNPNISNPHHVHSTPNVKDTKKVYLEYDPISKRQVLNTYEILKELGKGEHGKVKLGKDLNSNELVAIKIIDRKISKGKKLMKFKTDDNIKIKKEIAIMKKLNHPNIVQLKEVLDDLNSRKIYLILEYLEKGEIKWQKSLNNPFMTLPQAIKAFRDVLLGLEYLHYQGIIHRDIKPANLLISKDNSVKISDFGVSYIATNLQDLTNNDNNDLELAKTAGTPAFFAPELCQPLFDYNIDLKKINYKIDIWALGITLYCFLFGSMPFWGENEFELFRSINESKLKFPNQFPNNFDWNEEDKFEVKNLLFKMLEKDPIKRIGIKDIKKHSIVLKDLSIKDCKEFISEQSYCDLSNKIDVSNKELENAIVGIGHKLKTHISKAFKFAMFNNNKKLSKNLKKFPNNSSSSNSDVSISTNNSNGTSISNNLILYKTFDDNSFNKPIMKPSLSSSLLTSKNISRSQSVNLEPTTSISNILNNQGIETKTTVEGDLFLNNSSHALNSLNYIINDDLRKSNNISISHVDSTSSELQSQYLNSSLLDRNEIQENIDNDNNLKSKTDSNLVSLPINASFASLDSIYLDNYAPAYHHSTNRLSVSELSTTQSSRIPGSEPNFKTFPKMSEFSLNKLSSRSKLNKIDDNNDDSIAPDHIHHGEDSAISIPSNLIDDLDGFKPHSPTLESIKESNISIKKGDKPKYSFFENSDSDNSDYSSDDVRSYNYDYKSNQDDHSIEIEFAHSDDDEKEEEEEEEGIVDTSTNQSQFPRSNSKIGASQIQVGEAFQYGDDSESSNEGESEEEEEDLFLDFSRNRNIRGRMNSVAVAQASALSKSPSSIGSKTQKSLDTPTANNSRDKYQNKDGQTIRISSPLSKNAPMSPISSTNAHLYNQNQFVNHYQRVNAYHQPLNESQRERSKSITIGILQDKYNSDSHLV
ncbi:hypothetical protein WICMUC_001036 [Wickerhamomyces mucosus]|uniref:non-specific serine/threonine protein kinase n=1 Tax=Wickerhamomyces mucosus TaxID=1378264 RepID=A0A9P8TI04_9ASCO|nr:hypothetical protein WICMUC_001036 [Wickerhamomyces mucosus]